METEDGGISNVLELRKILKQKMVCMWKSVRGMKVKNILNLKNLSIEKILLNYREELQQLRRRK
jgi:hypothetical protein